MFFVSSLLPTKIHKHIVLVYINGLYYDVDIGGCRIVGGRGAATPPLALTHAHKRSKVTLARAPYVARGVSWSAHSSGDGALLTPWILELCESRGCSQSSHQSAGL